jgi:hypothetical protein
VIIYDLNCQNDHRFEGWFASSEDFERQLKKQLVACPLCGNKEIAKLPTAAYVRTANPPQSVATARDTQEKKESVVLSKLIRHVLENTEDVGSAFPEEARRIHYQEVPERAIRGHASQTEVRELKDEGIEVVSLPLPIPGGHSKIH